jgi:hypothetical protein
MIVKPQTFLDVLAERASLVEKEETDMRAEAAKLIDRLARDRVFAYRRLNLLRDMAREAAAADTAEDASAAAVLALCTELGWEQLTPVRQTIVGQLTGLADAVAEVAREVPAEDAAPAATARGAEVLEQLARFENWYEAEFGQPFFALFDTYVAETPVVDF